MMFERMMARAEQTATRRARAKRAALAEQIAAMLPRGIAAEEVEEGVAMSGKGLKRRLALEPALRWLVEGLK